MLPAKKGFEALMELLGKSKTVATKGSDVLEETPEVLGKGTSRLAKEASEEVPEAAFKEITPTTDMDDMSLWNRLDKKKAAALLGLGGAGALMLPEDETPSQPPLTPQDLQTLDTPEAPSAAPSAIAPSEPKPIQTGDIDRSGLDQAMKAFKPLPEEAAPAQEEESLFRKIIEEGIAGRAGANREADLLRASELISAGLSRTKAEHGGSDIRRARAKESMEAAESRIGAEKSQQAYNKAKSELGDEKAMRDPNSEISKLVSDLAIKTGLIKPGQQVSAMSLKNAGVNLGTLLATIEAGKARKEAAAMAKEEKTKAKEAQLNEKQRKFVQGLRKEATTGVLGKQYATYATGQRMANSLEQFAQNPSGYKDYASLMGGLKSLQGDESVVREAEVRMGVGATSAINAALNYLDRLKSGKTLQPQQRQEMIDTIKILTDASRQQYMYSVQPILEQAEMEGIDPELILSGSLSGTKKTEETPVPDVETKEFKQQMPPGSTVTTKSGKKYKIGPDGKTGTLIK